jgi:hypothetical protein
MSTAAKVLLILGGLCVMGFGGCVVCVSVGAKGVADQDAKNAKDFDDAPAITIDADALIKAYQDNEVAADEKYKGKKMRVTGKLASIDSGLDDEPVLQLGTQIFPLVQAHGVEKKIAANLKKDTNITVECKGDGELASIPQLKDCAVK